jgi:hypothetical protein
MGIRRDMPIWVVCGSQSIYSEMTEQAFADHVRIGIDAYVAGLDVPLN